jgi:hypothetical protein
MQQGTFYPYGAGYHFHVTNGAYKKCATKHRKSKFQIIYVIAVVEAVLLVTLINIAW